MSKKPSKPETRIEDYLDVMTGGNAVLPQPILRIEFYYAFLAGMTVELPQPILDDEKLLAKICGMEVEAPTYIPVLFPRLYAYMAKKGGQDVQVPDPILRLERYWYDYSAGEAPSVQEYTGAVPVTFTADGTPLLDYLISGNTAQSGTPTPDSPIMPEGTGERTGNLFDKNSDTINNNGQVRPGVTVSSGTYSINNTTDRAVYYRVGNEGTTVQVNAGRKAENISANGALYVWRDNNVRTDGVMLNTGSTALPYEPYGYKILISSANTTTPVYLGEVQTTRRIRKLVLTGEENWKKSTTYQGSFYAAILDNAMLTRVLCTHAEYVSPISAQTYVYGKCGVDGGASTKNINLFIGESSWTVDDFKAYIAQQYAAGTPVTVWYVLANEETAVVNEPLMRIGDYADTLSMEQAGVSIPTANGSTTLDVETTVPPSEIYIKYRGEAVATLSMLSAEVSNPGETTEEKNPEEMEEEENEC